MTTVQMAMLVFSALLFVLGAILVATLWSAMLTRQAREIGVMKAIGARADQLARLYATAVVAIASAILSVPVTAAVDGFLDRSGFLSAPLTISPGAIAGWLAAVVAGSALAALAPARRAARLTVREALAEA
jgi:putative ABC transport system permease protein